MGLHATLPHQQQDHGQILERLAREISGEGSWPPSILQKFEYVCHIHVYMFQENVLNWNCTPGWAYTQACDFTWVLDKRIKYQVYIKKIWKKYAQFTFDSPFKRKVI